MAPKVLLETDPLDQLHGEEMVSLVLAHVVDLNDGRMLERGQLTVVVLRRNAKPKSRLTGGR